MSPTSTSPRPAFAAAPPAPLRPRRRPHPSRRLPMSSRESPSGPYPVSCLDLRLPSTSPPGLRLRLFYPRAPVPVSRPAQWFPPSANPSPLQDDTVLAVLRFARLPAAPLLAPFLSSLPRRPLPAACGGPPRPSRFPLVLFSHGLGGSLANYCSLCIDVASHGFVVAAPEHTDASAFAAYVGDDRRHIPYAHFAPAVHGPHFRSNQLATRRDDLDSTLAALKAADKGETALTPLRTDVELPELKGVVDASTIVVAGHSFGAATVLSYAASRKGLVEKVVCLDAWLEPLGEDVMRGIDLGDADVLFVDQGLSGMKSSIGLREKMGRPSGSGKADAVKVVGGMHNNASDFPLRVPRYIALAARMTAPGSDPLALLEAQNRAVGSFLKGRESWQRFRNAIAKGDDDTLALASLGLARVLLKTET